MIDKKWVSEGGHIFVENVSFKKIDSHIKGEGFRKVEHRDSVAFNVGKEIADHIVRLHNLSL